MNKAEIIIYSILGIHVNIDSTPKTDQIDQSEEGKTSSHTTGLTFFGVGIALLVIGAIVLIVISKAGKGGRVKKGKMSGNTQEILYFV